MFEDEALEHTRNSIEYPVKNPVIDMFDKVDHNHNGFVSKTEIKKAIRCSCHAHACGWLVCCTAASCIGCASQMLLSLCAGIGSQSGGQYPSTF